MVRKGNLSALKKKGNKPVEEPKTDPTGGAVKVEAANKQVVKMENRKPEGAPTKERISEQEVAGNFAGLIFMCNTSTKQDCFRYRVFGLPEAKKHLVEKVTRGMRLFLFDVDLRLLYGIYKASSPGGFKLEAEAFRMSKKAFPWQVRFTLFKDCLPLAENVFKNAIKENYDDNKKFRIELTSEQVQMLVKLFRPIPRDAGAGGQLPPRMAPLNRFDAPPRIQYEPTNDRQLQGQIASNTRSDFTSRATHEAGIALDDFRLAHELGFRRETPHLNQLIASSGHLNQLIANSAVPRHTPSAGSILGYGAGQMLSELQLHTAEPYQFDGLYSAYPQTHSIGNSALELDALLRQRLQQFSDPQGELDRRVYGMDPLAYGTSSYTGIPNETLRKRPLEDSYLGDHGLVPPKRPHVQDVPVLRNQYNTKYHYEESARASGTALYGQLPRGYVGRGQ